MHLLELWYLMRGVVPLSEDESGKYLLYFIIIINLIGDATEVWSN